MIIEDARAKTLICKMLDDGRTVRVGSDIPEGLRARMGIDPESFPGAVLEIGATDTNDRGGLTGVHFITMRPARRCNESNYSGRIDTTSCRGDHHRVSPLTPLPDAGHPRSDDRAVRDGGERMTHRHNQEKRPDGT